MITYKKLAEVASIFVSKTKVLKFGFNLSPMYRRTSAKVIYISEDFFKIQIKLPFSYKNTNYVNTIFGGSMFAAVDPFPMTQLMNLIGDDYVVWDKAAEIFFIRPAKEDLYAEFIYSLDELDEIKKKVKEQNEFEIIKSTKLTNKDKSIVYCEVRKTVYIADKFFFKEKRKKRENIKT
tara:strand:- start:3 stop:536 length:534 start_codon:yes stop_codon:yes gene_type:complete